MTNAGCLGRWARHRRTVGSGTSLSWSPKRSSRAALVAARCHWLVRHPQELGRSNRTAIHFVVLPVAAVHLYDGGLITIGVGIHGRATECLGPVRGESAISLTCLKAQPNIPRNGRCPAFNRPHHLPLSHP
jgi:hypothetical protein